MSSSDDARWTVDDLEIVLDPDGTDRLVTTALIQTPVGDLTIMGEVTSFERELVLAGVHIQSESLGPNVLGPARVRQIAVAVAEMLDVEAVTIGGAARTTGAGGARGRVPRPIRFARPVRSQS